MTSTNKKSLHSIIPSAAPAATEGDRRVTDVAAGAAAMRPSNQPLDPEVPEIKPRRKFTSQYKLRILQKADNCIEPGQVGALLRSEGLYSSYLTAWRKQRDKGLLDALSPKKRGRKNTPKNPLADQLAQLEKENRQLKQKLKKAEIIIIFQKKMSEILGIDQPQNEDMS